MKTIIVTLAVLLLTLVPTECCYFSRGFLCIPNQQSCTRRGGVCSVRGGGCVCVPQYNLYGYGGSYPRYGGERSWNYVEPEGQYRHPLSEGNIERQTKLMTHFARLYNMWN